jgi:hypothetical protein
MYGLPAREPLGADLFGSYNTFLEQDSQLLVLNGGGAEFDADVELLQSSNPSPFSTFQLSVPANGLAQEDLSSSAPQDSYGMVKITAPRNRSVAWILRRKGLEYVIPTRVRP